MYLHPPGVDTHGSNIKVSLIIVWFPGESAGCFILYSINKWVVNFVKLNKFFETCYPKFTLYKSKGYIKLKLQSN